MRHLLHITLALLLVGCGTIKPINSGNRAQLIETEWSVTQLNGESIENNTESFNLIFGEDEQLGGVGACNRIMGYYRVLKRGGLRIESIGSTMMFCPNLELESSYIEALERVTRYVISDNILTLFHGNEIIMILSKIN